MRNMYYEKPSMKRVELRNQNAVSAKECWASAANEPGKKWYYDYNKGELGYLEFTMVSNCSGNPGSMGDIKYLPEEIGKTSEAERAVAYLEAELKTTVKSEFTSMITDDVTEVS